jgi:RimJ/RimL family protein N-acetyltransferase
MDQTNRGVSVRPITEDDMPFLFRLFADPGRCHLWMSGRRVYDERGFCEAWAGWTAGSIAAKFLVSVTGRPVGLVFDYDRSLEDGFTKVTALLGDERVGHGVGVIASALIVRWLFQTLPVHKVYMEVYGYNPAVVRMLRKVGLAEEGVLRRARFWDGAHWDLHIFALYRETWPEIRDRILRVPNTAGRTMTKPAAPVIELQSNPLRTRVGRRVYEAESGPAV